MRQELYIKGEVVGYSLLSKHITSVLGRAYIYKVPTTEEVLKIVYRGLNRTCGLTQDEFVGGFNTGTVWMSKKKGQYTLWMIYGLLRGRIREINNDPVECGMHTYAKRKCHD